ncbi:hypothetical protein R3P38DRAFT_3422619 [Favolaschia claudopus]|uniref:Ribosomal protein S10 n=1 Tax=Favolaschia claudopus TaxID=2862362 RepID=A0AAW0D741_9AGAR
MTLAGHPYNCPPLRITRALLRVTQLLRKGHSAWLAPDSRQTSIRVFGRTRSPRTEARRLHSDVMLLIRRMAFLALRHGHHLEVSTEEEPWIAQPLYTVVCDPVPVLTREKP